MGNGHHRTLPELLEERLGLRRLYEEHGSFVSTLAMRLLGPDCDPQPLTEDVFLMALHRPVRSASETRVWLAESAYVLAIRYRRMSWLRHLKSFLLMRGLADARGWISHSAAPADLEGAFDLYASLDRLPNKIRAIYILREIERFELVDIGAMTGCSIKAVCKQLDQAHEVLLRLMGKGVGGHV